MAVEIETGLSAEELAWNAYNHGDLTEALSQFLELAQDGRPYYLVVAAQMYANGSGTSIDMYRARDLLDRAISLDVPEAFLQRALLANKERDPFNAFRLLLEAERRGLDVAAYYLGICYLNGRGVERNVDKGLALLRQVSSSGHLGAKILLAKRALKHPQGVSDILRALWLLLSAGTKHLFLAIKNPHDERIR
jgi:TPR repeat protein